MSAGLQLMERKEAAEAALAQASEQHASKASNKRHCYAIYQQLLFSGLIRLSQASADYKEVNCIFQQYAFQDPSNQLTIQSKISVMVW